MLWVLITIASNICCGYSLELPRQGDSNEYPQHMFLWRNKQNCPLIITKYPPYLFLCLAYKAFSQCISFLNISVKVKLFFTFSTYSCKSAPLSGKKYLNSKWQATFIKSSSNQLAMRKKRELCVVWLMILKCTFIAFQWSQRCGWLEFSIVLYNAITPNNCFVKGSHKYDVYLVEENKAHLNWPNKDRIESLV